MGEKEQKQQMNSSEDKKEHSIQIKKTINLNDKNAIEQSFRKEKTILPALNSSRIVKEEVKMKPKLKIPKLTLNNNMTPTAKNGTIKSKNFT